MWPANDRTLIWKAPMEELIPIVMFVSIAAVAIFRPLTKRIGLMIEQNYKDRQAASQAAQSPQFERLTVLMERLVDRMDRLEDRVGGLLRVIDNDLEDRVDFTERMLDSRRAISGPDEYSALEEREREGGRSRRRG